MTYATCAVGIQILIKDAELLRRARDTITRADLTVAIVLDTDEYILATSSLLQPTHCPIASAVGSTHWVSHVSTPVFTIGRTDTLGEILLDHTLLTLTTVDVVACFLARLALHSSTKYSPEEHSPGLQIFSTPGCSYTIRLLATVLPLHFLRKQIRTAPTLAHTCPAIPTLY